MDKLVREASETVIAQLETQVARLRAARRNLPHNGWLKWDTDNVGSELHPIAKQLDDELSRRVTVVNDLIQLLDDTTPIDRLIAVAESLK